MQGAETLASSPWQDPGKHRERRATRPARCFQNPTRLANWARGFLCAGAVAHVVGIAQHLTRAYGLFAEAGEAAAPPELRDAGILPVAAVLIPVSLVALITAVVVSKWIYRANCNARALGASRMAFTPRAAVGWYFVPSQTCGSRTRQ